MAEASRSTAAVRVPVTRLLSLLTTGFSKTGNRRGRIVPRRASPLILAQLIVFVLPCLTGPLNVPGPRMFARQRPGEVLQEIERQRRERELRKKEKEEKGRR